MVLQTVPMRCCDDPLILKGVDRHEKVGKASLNPLCVEVRSAWMEWTLMILGMEDVRHSAGNSCCSVRGCDSKAIRSLHILMRRSGAWWMLAVWGVCWRDEENLLVNNRQMMCVIGLLVRKERIVVMTRDSLLLFVDKRCGDSEYTLHRTLYE